MPASPLPTSAASRAFSSSIRNLGANPLRTALSTLGIIIGVGALVAVLSVGDGMEAFARREISRTTDVQSIALTPRTTETKNGVSLPLSNVVVFSGADAADLQRRIGPSLVNVMQTGGVEVRAGDTSAAALLAATLPSALEVYGGTIAVGRFLTDADESSAANVTVLNHALAASLTPASPQSLLGTSVTVRGHALRVTGILAPSKDSGPPSLVVPLSLAGRVLPPAPTLRPPSMTVKGASVEVMGPLRDTVEAWLNDRYGSWGSRVSIATSEARLAQVAQGMLIFKLFMGAITGISLIVGGIGIMNVLLAAVAERTREIGIRRAVGARARDVLMQFLAESVAITGVGSALGAMLGLIASFSITALIRARAPGAQIEAAVTPGTLAFAMLAAIAVGLAFGLYPALIASRLAPIDAIRHE